MSKACDQTGSDRVIHICHEDRQGRIEALYRAYPCGSVRHNHARVEPGQFTREFRKALIGATREALFEDEVGVLDQSIIEEALVKGNRLGIRARGRRRLAAKKPNRGLRPLRSRETRPHDRRSAHKRDEIAPPHCAAPRTDNDNNLAQYQFLGPLEIVYPGCRADEPAGRVNARAVMNPASSRLLPPVAPGIRPLIPTAPFDTGPTMPWLAGCVRPARPC